MPQSRLVRTYCWALTNKYQLVFSMQLWALPSTYALVQLLLMYGTPGMRVHSSTAAAVAAMICVSAALARGQAHTQACSTAAASRDSSSRDVNLSYERVFWSLLCTNTYSRAANIGIIIINTSYEFRQLQLKIVQKADCKQGDSTRGQTERGQVSQVEDVTPTTSRP